MLYIEGIYHRLPELQKRYPGLGFTSQTASLSSGRLLLTTLIGRRRSPGKKGDSSVRKRQTARSRGMRASI